MNDKLTRVDILSKLEVMKSLPRNTSGQVLVITLLVMAVALTIGLSVVSRSITDIKISEQTEEAARAFSAAEAGIEQAIVSGSLDSFGRDFETGSFSVNKAGFGDGLEFAYLNPVEVDKPQTFWLADPKTLAEHYDRDRLRVVWGNPGTRSDRNETPALEVSLYYKDGSSYRVARFALDPNSSRASGNSFCDPGSTMESGKCVNVKNFITSGERVDGMDFQFRSTLKLNDFRGGSKTFLFARLRFIYSEGTAHSLGVKMFNNYGGDGNFPSQGEEIESVGTSGEATRKVRVFRYHPVPPYIFDSVLYSGVGLEK